MNKAGKTKPAPDIVERLRKARTNDTAMKNLAADAADLIEALWECQSSLAALCQTYALPADSHHRRPLARIEQLTSPIISGGKETVNPDLSHWLYRTKLVERLRFYSEVLDNEHGKDCAKAAELIEELWEYIAEP